MRNLDGTFTWWDDAVLYACRAAQRTGLRHRVLWAGVRSWMVVELPLEACS